MKSIQKKSSYFLKFKKSFFILAISSFNHLVFASGMNPFEGANFYINPDYQQEIVTFFAAHPDYKKDKIKSFFDADGNWNLSTAIWLDSKATILGDDHQHGILWHLHKALSEVRGDRPVTITFVVYDLPNRDCDAYSSNGEIVIDPEKDPTGAIALEDYKENYINKITAEFDQFYKEPQSHLVRTVLIIEPDSLPNMITNSTATSHCSIVSKNNIYQKGIAFALDQFSKYDNIAIYLDIAHSGWLGWATNANKIHTIYNTNSPNEGGLGSSFANIRGFITNTANYTPLTETFGVDSKQSYDEYLKENKIISNLFYGWNDSYSEGSYIAEILSLDANTGQLNQEGHRILKPQNALYQNMHFLIDTSRNGWADAAVDDHSDKRHHRGNWCNIENIQLPDGSIQGASFGAKPEANPTLLNPFDGESSHLPVDAYVWIKPQGESDGYFNKQTGKGDNKCGSDDVGGVPTDALQDEQGAPAPHAGQFFDRAFQNMIDFYNDKRGQKNSTN